MNIHMKILCAIPDVDVNDLCYAWVDGGYELFRWADDFAEDFDVIDINR
jgi:hypothetical protein